MNDRTIIYISSNKEHPEFERKTRETLLENCGELPIIAVTQNPVDLGPNSKNIVVGDIGASGFNFCRQIQIGVKEAKTDFVISAESDCLYPPDYFTFTPERLDRCYRNTNIYVLKYKSGFFKKKSSTFAQIVGREWYLKQLDSLFVGQPQWNIEMKNFPKEIGRKFMQEFEYFETLNPCLSFKTGRGMRLHTLTDNTELQEIPYWGTVEEVREYYES